MNIIFKFLNTDPKKYSVKTKLISFCLYMSGLIAFCAWFAIKSYHRSSRKIENLTHVSGVIIDNRIIKHYTGGKYRDNYEDVLVLSINGCEQEFGFAEDYSCYKDLTYLVNTKRDLFAEIFYDNSEQRIEQNVTLHAIDLKINNKRLVKIEDSKRIQKTGFLIFSSITILLILLAYLGAKRIKSKGLI